MPEVKSCLDAESKVTAPPIEIGGIQGFSAQRLQSQSHNIDRRVLVAVHHQPTMRAGMDSIREGLFDDHATSGTHLRRIPGIHQDHTRTSLLRFVLRDRDEQIPGNIREAFCQTMVFLHIFDIQIIEYNLTVLVHHPAGRLKCKIAPTVSNPLKDTYKVFS